MSFEEFDELLQRYLRGECTPDEERRVEKWYGTWGKGTANALDPARKASVESRLWTSLEEGKSPFKSSQRQMTPWKIARVAAAILVIAASLFVVFNRFVAFDADHLLAGSGDKKEIQNTGRTPLKVTLEDGSVVSLEPGSALNYVPASFTAKRELHLTGEAFFEVVKDKKHPFLVYASGITTKVLGTSFRIKAYQQAKEITVSVSTGRVAVFKQSAQKENNPNPRAEVILTPNQQFVYHKTDDKTEKKLVEDPQIVLREPSLKTHYTNVSVAEIFETLEENYGVVMEYDEEVLAGCTITTTLASEGLYEKVDIICQAIGARYVVNGTSIVIEASGCD